MPDDQPRRACSSGRGGACGRRAGIQGTLRGARKKPRSLSGHHEPLAIQESRACSAALRRGTPGEPIGKLKAPTSEVVWKGSGIPMVDELADRMRLGTSDQNWCQGGAAIQVHFRDFTWGKCK